ncbi:MAG: hypothetical protein IJQ84_05020 [Paludibacteraceae bacterium]|nr:hypothetical protein [Paludibacteraceae bacterium]
MKPDGTPDVQDILAQVEELLSWEKERLVNKLLTRDMLHAIVGNMDIDEINDYTGYYCYEDEMMSPDNMTIDDVMKHFCKSDVIEWLIKTGASMTMFTIMCERGVLKDGWISTDFDLPDEGMTVLFIPGYPMQKAVYEGHRNGNMWRSHTCMSSFSGEGAVIYWKKTNLPKED